jgi:anaerobic selenocysteine-containing dehydrogenase
LAPASFAAGSQPRRALLKPGDPAPVAHLQGLAPNFLMPLSPSVARAQCPYCGVGCGLELKPPEPPSTNAPASDPTWTARGDRHHPSSLGQVCVKGATVGETLGVNRLTTPLWRERTDQPFAPISWERAMELLVARIQTTLATRGPGALAIYGSGQFLTEDYYVGTPEKTRSTAAQLVSAIETR